MPPSVSGFDTVHMLQCHYNHVALLKPCNSTFMQATCLLPMSLLVPSRTVHFHVHAVPAYQHQRQLNDT